MRKTLRTAVQPTHKPRLTVSKFAEKVNGTGLAPLRPAPVILFPPQAAIDTGVGGVSTAENRSLYSSFGKSLLDIFVVLLTLPVTLTVIALAALALWIEGGNPFYVQERLGQNGRVFRMVKLRTMSRNAEAVLKDILAKDPKMRAEWQFTQKLKKDPRITPVGGFLRRTSIDELPQIWNVLIGDMSLVGPRPMMPDQLPLYGDPRAYFALHPGISGFWQVCERNETSFAMRADADRSYLGRVSFWVDLVVLFKTLSVVVRRTGY